MALMALQGHRDRAGPSATLTLAEVASDSEFWEYFDVASLWASYSGSHATTSLQGGDDASTAAAVRASLVWIQLEVATRLSQQSSAFFHLQDGSSSFDVPLRSKS